MRRFAVPLAVLGLAALLLGSRAARADDPAPDPLAKARALEREGQELLDAGRCAEGARHMAAAWQIRAEVWGGGARPDRGPEDPVARERRPDKPSPDVRLRAVEDLRAAFHAQELAIEEARKNGAERAEAEHKEAADALRTKIRALLGEAVGGPRKERRDDDLVERLRRARAERKEAEALADKLAAEGKADEAEAQKARAKRLHRAAEELAAEVKARAAEQGAERPAGGRGAAAVEGLAGDVARLRAEVEEVRRLLEALKARLSEPGK